MEGASQVGEAMLRPKYSVALVEVIAVPTQSDNTMGASSLSVEAPGASMAPEVELVQELEEARWWTHRVILVPRAILTVVFQMRGVLAPWGCIDALEELGKDTKSLRMALQNSLICLGATEGPKNLNYAVAICRMSSEVN